MRRMIREFSDVFAESRKVEKIFSVIEQTTCILGSIASVQTGPFGSQLHREDYVASGTPIITVEHLIENRISHENLPLVSDGDKERLSKYTLKEGDIVFSRVGSVDRCAYVSKNEDGWLFSGRCLRIRGDETKVIPRYLSFYFTHPSFKAYIRQIAVGATMPSLNTTIMNELEIPLPPLPTQKKIAAILSSLDDKIEINTRVNKVLEEIARALFHRWFVEFEFPNDEGKPYKSSGGRMIESEMGEIPEGWRGGTLDEIAKITMGQSPSGTSYNEQGTGTVFYQGRAEFGFRYPSRRLYTTEPKRMAEKGDVLLSVRAPVGDVNIANEPCCIGRGLAAIQSIDNYSSFIYYLMLDLQKTLDSFNGEGTVFGSINRISLASLIIVLPPDSYLELFEPIARNLDLLIEKNSLENINLQIMRNSLLSILMSGELFVADFSDVK